LVARPLPFAFATTPLPLAVRAVSADPARTVEGPPVLSPVTTPAFADDPDAASPVSGV
jgi:hypothetical protein